MPDPKPTTAEAFAAWAADQLAALDQPAEILEPDPTPERGADPFTALHQAIQADHTTKENRA